MFAPEITYRYLYPKDIAGPTFEIASRFFTTTDTVATITHTFDGVPKDKILVLSNISMIAVPGLAQAPIQMQVTGFTQAGVSMNIQLDAWAAVANAERTSNWQGEVWLPGRGRGDPTLTFYCAFDAGAVANLFNASFHGVMVPRGNSGAW